MNATTVSTPAKPSLSTGGTVIAIDPQNEIDKRACGRIVMWSNQGDVTSSALAAALIAATSHALPPEEPSALVALHRAVDAVAKTLGHLDVHHKARGSWAIVSKPTEVEVDGKKTLQYPIACEAKVERDKAGVETLTIEGQGAEQIRAAYEVARHTLAPSDIGTWLCDKLTALKAVALRDRGGVYFLPQFSVDKWNKIVKALQACSKHRVHVIPAMRSSDAAEAILASLTDATRQACNKIADDIADGDMGERALANREKETASLLERVAAYEGLLGGKLDELRAVIDETRAAVATAALATAGQ